MSKSKDYIPSISDYYQRRDEIEEYQKTHEDPRHTYIVSYKYNGRPVSEEVFALDESKARKNIIDQFKMIGIFYKDEDFRVELKKD